MKPLEPWKDEIDKVMGSLEGVQRAGAPPHLYTRVRARLQTPEPAWYGIARFLSKPFVALALSLLLLAVNGWFIWRAGTTGNEEPTEQILSLAREYHLEPASLLDQNPMP